MRNRSAQNTRESATKTDSNRRTGLKNKVNEQELEFQSKYSAKEIKQFETLAVKLGIMPNPLRIAKDNKGTKKEMFSKPHIVFK